VWWWRAKYFEEQTEDMSMRKSQELPHFICSLVGVISKKGELISLCPSLAIHWDLLRPENNSDHIEMARNSPSGRSSS
jgi:hypothetical protein